MNTSEYNPSTDCEYTFEDLTSAVTAHLKFMLRDAKPITQWEPLTIQIYARASTDAADDTCALFISVSEPVENRSVHMRATFRNFKS